MPTYCYIHEKTGARTERFYPMGEAPRTIKVRSLRYRRDLIAEQGHVQGGVWKTPRVSEALGVGPEHAAEAVRVAAAAGVHREFDDEGRAVFPSRANRNEVLKFMGCHDASGGYGDH